MKHTNEETLRVLEEVQTKVHNAPMVIQRVKGRDVEFYQPDFTLEELAAVAALVEVHLLRVHLFEDIEHVMNFAVAPTRIGQA